MKKVTKAVIPAAGLGTRVLPATKAMPKGMLPIVDKHPVSGGGGGALRHHRYPHHPEPQPEHH